MVKFKCRKSTSIRIITMIHPFANVSNEANENEAQMKTFNFVDSFRPVYYFSRLFGLMPFTINCDSYGDVQKSTITKFDGFWLVISVVLYSLMPFFINVLSGPFFVIILGYIFAIIGFIYSVLKILVDVCNRSKYIAILKKITIFDKEVRHTQMLCSN